MSSTFDVGALLASPEPWGLPHELTRSWDEQPLSDLSTGERTLYLVEGYLREVGHGGHEYWFGTLYADAARATVESLKRLGLDTFASICERSFSVWPGGEVPEDFDERETRIVDEWLADDPDDVMPRLNVLDDELYAENERVDDVIVFYRYISEHPGEFGVAEGLAPTPDEVETRLRAARAASRAASDAEPPGPEDPPVPASDSFGRPAGTTLLLLGSAASLAACAVLLQGELPALLVRILLLGCGVLLWLAWKRWRYRIVMDPKGVHAPGGVSIPWSAMTSWQILMLEPQGGFAVDYRSAEGSPGRLRVPRTIDRYSDAMRTFLALAQRHGAPWAQPTWKATDEG